MKIFFKKSKKPYFGSMGAILAFFAQIWAKMDFPRKKRLYQFLKIPIIYHLAKKKKKKKKNATPEKNAELTDGWTDRLKDGQTTVGPPIRRGSNY